MTAYTKKKQQSYIKRITIYGQSLDNYASNRDKRNK